MFFDQDDDEQDFLSPAAGSKLASLFNIDKQSNKGGNESLTYTAPKQPKKETPSTATESTPALTMACAVQAFKYVGNEYKSQGKLGAAILSNDANKEYQILLYVTKEKQVTNVLITKSFIFTMQPNNYAMFYDAAKQGWSILFESEQVAHKFAIEVAIAKFKTCDGVLDTAIVQDLVIGEGNPLENGDSAEVKYTGWLLTNKKLGQVFDSNVNADKQFRFKVGKGKVIKGWDSGVLGMKKGGQRVLVIPPNLAYGEIGMGEKIPPNSSLVFQFEISRVKISKTDDAPEPTVASDPVMFPTSESGNIDSDGAPTEETVKSRSRSINEQLAQSPKSDKARLISRMARMGQPMLPIATTPTSLAGGDSETEEVPPTSMDGSHLKRPDLPQKPASVVSSLPPSYPSNAPSYSQATSHQMVVYQNPLTHSQPQHLPMAAGMYHQVAAPDQTLGAYPANATVPVYNQHYSQHSYPAPVSSADVHVPVILSETRQHNTEMRLAVNKITDKMDQVLYKLEHSSQNTFLNPVPSLETSVLMQNIQRIVQENDRLKNEVMEKGSKVESQNMKISELIQQNQKFLEQSNSLLEQRNDSYKNSAEQSQAQVLKLEKEKANIASELSSATSMVSNLQLEISAAHKQETELRQMLNSSINDKTVTKGQVETLNKQIDENRVQLEEITNSYKEERQQRKALSNKISQLNEEISDLKSSCESLEKNISERKKKALNERRRHEEEIDELKTQFEADLESFRKKIRSQKVSVTASEQSLQLEEDLKKHYEEKANRSLQLAEEKHQRQLADLAEEKSGLEQSQKELHNKIANQKLTLTEKDTALEKLNEQFDHLSGWKEKYERLRSQASSMKIKYVDRINELESEIEQFHDRENTAKTTNNGNTDVVSEVKKVMNAVYQSAKSKLEAENNYKGSEVLSILLHVIKSTTLNLVSQEEPVTNDMSESSDKESESETIIEVIDENDNNVQVAENKEDQDQVQTPENISNKKIDQVLENSNEQDSSPDNPSDNYDTNDNCRKASCTSTSDYHGTSDDIESQELTNNSNLTNSKEIDVNSNISIEKSEQSNGNNVIKSADVTNNIGNGKQDMKIDDGSNDNDGVSPFTTLAKNASEESTATEFFSSTSIAEKKPSNASLKNSDSSEELRSQGPPPLFGSDDDDDYNRDLFD
ncbi:FK506-binding protein 15-like isoform X1 [Argonauta hians]